MPLRPMLVPPAATACHEWAGVPGTQQAVLKPAVGTTQETSPTSVDPLPTWPVGFSTRLSDSSGAAASSVSRILAAKAFSASSYSRSLSARDSLRITLRECFVGQDLDDSAQVLGLELGLGGQGAGLGAFEQPRIELADDVGLRVANVKERFGEIRDDVGGVAAGRDDMMNSREVGSVLAQQLGRVGGELDRVEGRPALLRCPGGMRALAPEPELGGDPGLARLVAGRVLRSPGASAARRRSR